MKIWILQRALSRTWRERKAFVRVFLSAFLAWVQVFEATAIAASKKPASKSGTEYLKEALNHSLKENPKDMLGELYKSHRKVFPYELQRELDYRIKKMGPGLPKPEFESVLQGKKRIIRLRMREGKNTVTFQLTEPSTYELVGTINGKPIKEKFEKSDFEDPLIFLGKITGQQRTITQEVPTVRLLSRAEIAKMNETTRKAYVDRLRATLAAAEVHQNALYKIGARKKALFPILGEWAIASSPSGPCIVAGWKGEYKDGSCHPPAQAFETKGDTKVVRCNDMVYGPNVGSFQVSNGRIDSNATQQCNTLTESNKYAPYQKTELKNEAEFDARKQELTEALTQLEEGCKASGSKLSDQPSTCSEFTQRTGELKSATCKDLAAQKQNFPSLVCAGDSAPAPAPSPGGPSEKEEEETEPPPGTDGDPGPVDDAGQCEPHDNAFCSGKRPGKLDCGTGSQGCVACNKGNGRIEKWGYCICTSGTPEYGNRTKPYACKEQTDYGDRDRERFRDRDDDDTDRESRRRRRDRGFLGLSGQNWLALGLVGLVAYYAFTQMNSQPMTPPNPVWPNPPVPPPTTGPVTTPGGRSIPVINTR